MATLQERVADALAHDQTCLAGILAEFRAAVDELVGSAFWVCKHSVAGEVAAESPGVGVAVTPSSGELEMLLGALQETTPAAAGELDHHLRHPCANDTLTTMDVTVRRRAADIDRSLVEAQAALRMRDDLFSIVAHELKTPLTTLLGYTDALNRRAARTHPYILEERDRRALEIIADQSQRLNLLIESLLDVSRIQDGRLAIDPQPMDLYDLVQQTVTELRPALSSHSIVLIRGGGPMSVDGDRLRLEQVLQNLLQNAIKYSPNGGEIVVCVEHQAGQVVLSVRDQGIGIPAAAQAQLFQRFYRAENATAAKIKGMGVGLYVVNEIVTLHGGTIEVNSVEGAGAAFIIRFPSFESDSGASVRVSTLA
jgi:signal transduction histidine kinase